MPKFLVLLLTAVLSAAGVAAMPPSSAPETPLDQTTTPDYDTYINVNDILSFVTNRGGLCRDLSDIFGHDAGFFYPYTSVDDILSGLHDETAVYSAGLWLGGKVNGEIRVALAEYGLEYVPGPMAGGTFQPDNPAFKVYKLYADSLAGNPNADYLNWPADQGAPVNPDGTPKMLGDQMLWTVFNDANPAAHMNDAGDTDPLGVEVRQTVWGLTGGPGWWDRVIYLQYDLFNRGENAISDFYLSFWVDPDVGGPGDDFVGCDTVANMFYAYNADDDDAIYGAVAPAVGGALIRGPVIPSPGSRALFFGAPLDGYRNLPMTSFNRYVNGWDPTNAAESYNCMSGFNADGSPIINPQTGDPTTYYYPGRPFIPIPELQGWVDDLPPSDRRMMASFGPMTFLPGDSQQVLLVLGAMPGSAGYYEIHMLSMVLSTAADFPRPIIPRAEFELDTLYAIWANWVNPMDGWLWNTHLIVGYDSLGERGATLDPYTVTVTGFPPPDSAYTAPSYPGFNGEVVVLEYFVPDLVRSFGPLWGTTVQDYQVSAPAGDQTYVLDGQVTLIGHRRGDLNSDGNIDVRDLTSFVNFLFKGGPPPRLMEAADLNLSGNVNIADLQALVKLLFY